jgi:hypothetical protein
MKHVYGNICECVVSAGKECSGCTLPPGGDSYSGRSNLSKIHLIDPVALPFFLLFDDNPSELTEFNDQH